MKKAVKIRALKLLVTGVFVGALILTLAVIAGQTPTLAAPATTISINNSADLIAYSREYANGQHNPQDTLSLALSTGSMYVLPENGGSGYISIGSDSRPFDGQILIADSASATFLLDTPLFGTMTTNVTIGNGSGSVRQVEIMRSSDVDDVPLFAQKVVAVSGASDAVWSVKLNPDDSDSDNITAFKFAGVVGEIGDGCSVSLAFEHNSVTENAQGASVTANVTASGDVGILCGTLGEGSTLIADVTLGSDMAGKTFNVTSVSGNAGGVVGYMKDGSSVVMKNGFASFFNVTADAGFAGGIAGYAENADISVDTAPSGYFTVTKAISGADGAGALYGYYESTKNNAGASGGTRTFDLKNLRTDEDIAISAGSSSAAGGVIGRLYAENSITVTDGSVSDVGSVSAYDRTVKFTGGKYRGGVIGSYANTSLDNVLEILNVPVKIAGNSGSNTESAGAIGEISDADGTSAAYVKINGLRVENSGTISAGAVGKMGSKGSFVDFTGRYKGKGTRVAGLVDDMGCGVIRISGVTDLSETTSNTAQLVNKRGNGLIYALGSGADTAADALAGNGWRFQRGSGSVDDVAEWGEVLRVKSAYNGLSESDFFTVDADHHTVTVTSAVTTINNKKDFIKTALNIQHNIAEASVGALVLDSGSRSSTLLASTLTLGGDIDLVNTGIVGLMRDNVVGEETLTPFTGTFDGDGHTVSLAIGETYGIGSDGNVKTQSNIGRNNWGTSCRHRYIGLISKTSGATVTDLTVSGFISDWNVAEHTVFIGGVVAVAEGSGSALTLSGINTAQQMKIYTSKKTVYCGGAIGQVGTGTTGTVAVGSSDFSSVISDTRKATESYFGGVIGHVAATGSLTFDFDDVSVGGSYNNTVGDASAFDGTVYGGLIGYIAGNSGTFSRNVLLNNITLKDGFSITSAASTSAASNSYARTVGAGAFIGGTWLDTNVTIGTQGSSDGVILGGTGAGPSITVPSGNNVNIGALVYKATGHWTVNHVKVNHATVTSASNATFGFIVNDGHTGDSALYLDLYTQGYDISAFSFTNGGTGVYDEVVAFSNYKKSNGNSNIEENGQAIVSVSTTDGNGIIVTGSKCNTYQNQTAYGQNTVTTNANTRYYYNLASIRAKASPSAAEKMLLWSLNRYAAASISANGYFDNNYNNRITGNCDMKGLSYYPVDASGVTISNATVKFYNREIESGESGTGNTDGVARSTRTQRTQHYMMHEGIFLNYTGELNVNGLTLKGNVSNRHGGVDNGSGFLICGTLGGTEATTKVTINNLSLAGARIDRSGANVFAPLLINRIGKKVNFSLSNVSAVTGSSGDKYPNPTTAVASSLIGNVGGETATNINLTFSGIALDARTAEGGLTGLTTAYGTSRSLFDRATFLESFRFLSDSLGEYNYTYSEDWTDSQHKVTYAKEITSTQEYREGGVSKENHYYDDTRYTHPTDSTGASAYDFSTGFLPHVYVAYNAANLYHEIKINIKEVNLTAGCGQYNDPYQITDGGMLATAAKIISGNPDLNIEVTLPNDLGSEDMWCDNRNSHAVYKWNGSNFVLTGGSGDPLSLEDVRVYLAGAYYSIEQPIVLPSNFVGFGYITDWTGKEADYECQYAFRGVIVGTSYTQIINKSPNPLVKVSNGCVVKKVWLQVDASIPLNQASNLPFRYDDAGCKNYGAVIGQVMGGDTIIDHVGVSFTGSATFSLSGTYKKLVPIGGFVGVVVNGGVVFRNMSDVTEKVGLTSSTLSYVANDDWLYVNPIVGRVITGYAFNETTAYEADPDDVMLDNGVNNYSIPDLNKNTSGKIGVTASSEYSHEITVPDPQSLYLLACIVNSGAGSAQYGSNTNAYPAMTNTPWSGYRKYTQTRCGTYDDVGTTESSSADYTDVAEQDVYLATGEVAKVPYIIRKYTSADGGVFKARSICNGSAPADAGNTNDTAKNASNADPEKNRAAVRKVELASGDFELPASFRGIGSLYYADSRVRLVFNRFDGKGANIIYNTYFLDYDMRGGSTSSTPATVNGVIKRTYENYSNVTHVGLGLFSQFEQRGATSSNTTNVITGFTVNGSIYYDIINYSNGGSVAYNWEKNTVNAVFHYNVLNVGGVIGSVYGEGKNSAKTNYRDIFNITGVTLGDIDFEGAKSVGGLVGFVYHNGDSRTRVIKKCGSASGTGVKITAGLNGGGLVGYLHRNFTITGNSASNKTEVFVDSIKIKGTNTTGGNVTDVGFDYINGERLFAAGGLIGFTDPKYACSITNYRVAGVEKTGAHIYSTNTDADVHIFAGGIIGVYKNATLTLTNLDVSGLDLKATYSGGVFGAFLHDNSGGMTITATNITVDGGSGKSDIEALRTASGFIARNESTNQNGVSITTLTNFKLKNYNVKSTSTTATGITTQGYSSAAYMQAAGAISGYSETTHNNGNTYKLHEITVEDCDISANFEGNNETDGVGGLFGAARNLYVTGANILLDGTTVNYYPNGAAEASNTDYRVGGVLGNNMNTLTGSNVRSYIKLVGVSIHDCNELTRLCGKRNDSSGGENFGPDGYIVLADFYGASAEDGRNTSHATLATGSTERAAAAPYVTVNPASNIGNSQVRLTGDGIAPNEDSLPAEDILDNDWRYNYVQSINRSTGQLYDSYFKIFKNYNYVNKLSTFNTEQSNSLTDDFAVLVIEETNRNRCTNIINGYLNLLANTNYDYASVNDAIYTVNIYRMNYNGTKFAPVENTEANLKRDTTNHHFYMLNTNESTDTSASGAGTLFSLIDVAFYDPAENTKIAYHLYVPVIVKKLLKFNFEVATGSGTNYESAWYGRNDRYGQPVMENLGTPVTIYFSYDYLRSKAEWQQALDNGENMLRNYAKSLVFVKDGALENYLPADTTVLVLVDPNNGGKAYYARFADVYSNGTLSLSGFRERLDDATSAAFAPVTFDDMLDISAEPGDGSYVEWQQGDSAAATVTAVYNNNVLRLRPATDADSSRQHYNLIVENDDDPATGHLDAKESYYISFFTASQSGALLYHYRIECPQSFDDPNYPSRMGNRNAEETVAHMILGNIFVQTGASLAATNVNEEMVVSENDTLTVSMETTVKINDSIRSEVAGYLAVNSPIQVYQSFLVDLTRTEKDGSHRKIITGYPEFTGSTYGIASVNGSVAAIEDDYPTITQNPNYAEFINGESLNAYLTGGNGAVITADVNIIYSGSENIAAQFPSKGDLSDRSTGVTIAGTSNVAFDPASTAFSTSRQEMTDTNNRLYYCLIDDNTAKLYYNVKSDIYGGDYGALGINPLDTDGLTLVGVSTIAVHDITNIFDDAAEYDIVRCTIQLYRRQDNYLTPLVIGDYLQDLNLVDLESATGFRSVKTDPTKYIYYFPKSAANTELETNIVIPIDFGVITGADLESEGYYYSNYKVALDVELVKETTPGNYARLQKSRDSNFIIYTNARIIPDFVDTD